MICPFCNVAMKHLNNGGGFAEDEKYQTWDHLECSNCGEIAIEFYHTEFIKSEDMIRKPVFGFMGIDSSKEVGTVGGQI